MPDDSSSPEIDPIKLVDRNSDLDRFDEYNASVIRGLLHNRQISGPSDDNPDHLVQSLKHTREQIPRRSFTKLENVSGYDLDQAERILNIFRFEADEALEFQLESWKTITEFDDERRETGDNRGTILSAPTGFGKTVAFMGPIYDKILNDRDFSSTIIVYPRTALLKDQLSGILERLVSLKESDEYDGTFSVGAWIHKLPYEENEVTDPSRTGIRRDEDGRLVFTLANYWDNDSDEDQLYISSDGSEIFNEDVTISLDEFVFAKKKIEDNTPDILLTTLESLENFSLKPNRDIIDDVDAIIFDEVHQYSGIRGSHAANIIDNIKSTNEDPFMFIGSSATIESPDEFGEKLFGLSRDTEFRSVEPFATDFDNDSEDFRNHYFLLSREQGAGAASMYIQQMMMMGHSLIDPIQEGEVGERAKLLSFIDSKSQIHQREDQFQDADHTDELWRLHDGGDDSFFGGDPDDDYRRVAENTNHEFITEPIQIDRFHADSDTSIGDLDDMEIIQSTSSLEVGIDIEDIEIVTQYREPLGGLSSFVQRAGRAGREENKDAHVITMLSSYAGDSNFYYRADRFLESDITTPLRTDNSIVNELHGMILAYYQEMYDIYQGDTSNWWRQPKEEEMLQRVFSDRLDADPFYRFLTQTRGTAFAIAGFRPEATDLLSSSNISSFRSAIDSRQDQLREEIDEIEHLIGSSTGDVIQGDDPVNGLLDRISEESLDILANYREYLEGLSEEVESEREEILEELEETEEILDQDQTRIMDKRLAIYRRLSGKLLVLSGKISQAEGELPSTDEIQQIIDSLEKIEQAVEEGTIREQRDERKLLHYLERSLDEIEDYVESPTPAPHGSLPFVKSLFRAAYFFDQCLRLSEDHEALGLNYYPENYFGGGGKSFTLSPENRHESNSIKSLDTILNQYAPFKSEYLSRTGEMQAFIPDLRNDNGEIVMSFDNLAGRREDDIKIPERLPMSDVEDMTGTRSQGIVPYDPLTYEIYGSWNSAPPRVSPDAGKIHSEPHVTTDMDHTDGVKQFGNLSMGDVSAKAALSAVTLEISPAYWNEENNEWRFTGRTEYEQVESTDPKLGFVLDTRGITWNIVEFINGLDSIEEDVHLYKDLEDLSLEELGLNTAAHVLTLLVADISGVNSEQLLHGIDREENQVFVFERTEGGQGVVDLFFETLEEEPHTVLRSLLRLIYNSQIMNERLCAHEEFVDGVEHIDLSSEEERKALISDLLDVDFGPVLQRVSEELLSTVNKVDDIVDAGEDVSQRTVLELKQDLAQERIDGTDRDSIPDEIYEGYEDITAEIEVDYLEELLVSPDIDGCQANLHMHTTLFNQEQGETLSYVIVRALRDYILDYIPREEGAEEILEREQLWGGETDDQVVFPTF